LQIYISNEGNGLRGNGRVLPLDKILAWAREQQVPFGFAQGRLSPGFQPGEE
jgi:hypothetical protein